VLKLMTQPCHFRVPAGRLEANSNAGQLQAAFCNRTLKRGSNAEIPLHLIIKVIVSVSPLLLLVQVAEFANATDPFCKSVGPPLILPEQTMELPV
jgi:hypothetical protein